uniref:Pentacotripeptide-repeat region of PRORP domain-containing protein n=1 Tax=Rhodosorus marinus TaxID=101924 RepID=A0A7S0BE22_9RHOD|mmetsp:Transcript_11936/g.17275  ORF Transcript_11936/g.17275 Transcript_11936/m.17275 type:complete len:560 (+) Transcript_11936:753-2432(+)
MENSTCNVLIQVFGATNDLEAVESLHNELRSESVRLDRRSTNILLKAYARAGSMERCLQEYGKLQEQSSFIPNSETYSILISEHLALGNRDEAENLLHQQRSKKIRVHYNTFSAFMRHYASSYQFDRAEKTMKAMRESGIEPQKDVYHHMIVSHSRCGNLQQAMTWFHAMKAAHELSSVEYSILLSLVAKMRNLRLFTAIINSIEGKKIEKSGYTYATMIRTFSRARRLDLAAEAFEEMRQNKLADSAGYNVFIDAVCTQETPDFARARALISDMVDQGVPPSSATYGTVIHHLSRRGHGEEAVQMFQEMTKRGLPPTVITYTQVMRALSRGDQPLKAIAYWERMKREGIKPNAITYVVGIAAHCRAGELDIAYQILEDQKAANITPLSGCFHALMQAEMKRGNMEKTMDLYKLLMESNVEPNLSIFEVMLRMLLRLGEVGEVELLFETMKKFELRPPKWALIMLFKRFALDAELPKMLRIMDMFIERRIPISAGISHGMQLISFELAEDKEMANEFGQKLQLLRSNPEKASQKWHSSQRTSRSRQLELGPAQHMNKAS